VGAGLSSGALRRGAVLALCLALVALAALAAAAWPAQDDLDLVSRASGAAGAKGNGESVEPAVSANGRFVVYSSFASNLHPDDTDTRSDVFVRDPHAGTTTLVSRATGAASAKGNGFSFLPAISADGRIVAFRSSASNLHPDDADATPDVFVRDLQAGTTTLVSRAAGAAGAKGNNSSLEPAVSADGRFVAFASWASNLHPDDADAGSDVFVRDLQADTTTLVSRAGGAKGNSDSFGPAVSADGRFVAFESWASNLHPEDADTSTDVFVRDLQADTATLVSRAAGAAGAKGNSSSGRPAVSTDGRFVAFESFASNLHPDDTDADSDVFVRDLQADTTTLVSRAAGAAGGKGNEVSFEPTVSADARFVAFTSWASNLHPEDADLSSDVFVRDLEAGTTTLVSRAAGAAGPKGNDDSFGPALSADGRFMAFTSSASNLHPDDADTSEDVFVRYVLGAPPSPQPEPEPAPRPQPSPPPAPASAKPPPSPAPGPVASLPQPGCPLAGNAIVATNGDDARAGTALSDVIFGLSGDDLLRGLGGADCLYGQQGSDRLLGASGADHLDGGPGHDTPLGGGGSDRLLGRAGEDRLFGGAGGDRLDPGSGRDRVAAGSGNDRVVARGGVRDTIDCGPGRRDVAIVDRLDRTRRCERVRRGGRQETS
jgi:Tol biopolymer transport system component